MSIPASERNSAMMLTTVIITAGAISAVIGIGQYSILHYDNLGMRPRSTLGLRVALEAGPRKLSGDECLDEA